MLFEKKPLGTIAYLGQWANPGPFTWSMIQLCQFCNEYLCKPNEYIHWDYADTSGQILMRNQIISRMLGDWILFIDSDHNFDPDLAYRLLHLFQGYNEHKRQLDVLSGIYHFKVPPHSPVAWIHRDEGPSAGYCQLAQWDRTKKIMPIDSTGAGCLLIRRSVIERLVEHYNDFPFNPIGKYSTDDFDFYERCRLLGIQCWWAPQIECQHLRWQAIKTSDYKPELVIVPSPEAA